MDLNVETIKVVADLGFTIIAAAIILVIAYKMLNTLLNQNKSVANSLLPQIKNLEKQLSDIKNTLNEHLASHNTMSSIKLTELGQQVEQLMELEQSRINKLDQIIQLQTIIYTLIVKNGDNIASPPDIVDVDTK